MEKVKLTTDVAKAIKLAVVDYGSDNVMNRHTGHWEGNLAPLNKIAPHELARALYIGYETEPVYKVGDWAVPNKDGYLGKYHPQKITKIDKFGSHVRYFLEDGLWSIESQLRHATPEEITEEKECRWWKKHDRDVWELKDCDLLIDISTGNICTVWIEHNDLHLTTKGNVVLSIYDPKRLKGDYEVLCFVEDRKDIKA